MSLHSKGAIEAYRIGVAHLRRLGMRPTELARALPVSIATIKRYAGSKSLGPPLSLTKPLQTAQREFLARFWVERIALGKKYILPASPHQPLLARFCPICAHSPDPNPRSEQFPAPVPSTLADAIAVGFGFCEAGVRPCPSGPARLAVVSMVARADPWAIVIFLTQDVNPKRWWLRACLGCDNETLIATPSVGEHLCPRHRESRHAEQDP